MRICKKCSKLVKTNKPDPCINRYLPGIAHACCGHGENRKAYCCGFKDCKPNESLNEKNMNNSYWELRGEVALDYIADLMEKSK